jgi:hypothetical protein
MLVGVLGQQGTVVQFVSKAVAYQRPGMRTAWPMAYYASPASASPRSVSAVAAVLVATPAASPVEPRRAPLVQCCSSPPATSHPRAVRRDG